ncbi:adenylate kinase [bacterium (Candidatus Torokbacteria) CG_4_10_14_0_2_um_filter_35_8]|nr:MAG: adenylate kinase [bacterium (Candidatus Torokbacteria) CG_4_10_14_0_2_um_filter_35_8]
MSKSNIILVVLGPQGSGKGTQAEMLAKKFNLTHIQTGNIFREKAEEDTPLGRKIDRLINKEGRLVPDEIVFQVWKEYVEKIPQGKGIILDGNPRTLEQAKFIDNFFKEKGREINKVFYIGISGEETIKRLSVRRVCKDCKKSLRLGIDVEESDKCPKCGGELFQREDDTPERIKVRLDTYKEVILPLVDYYKKQDKLVEINGEQPIEKVFEDIVGCIED